jgi:hypothetical protein
MALELPLNILIGTRAHCWITKLGTGNHDGRHVNMTKNGSHRFYVPRPYHIGFVQWTRGATTHCPGCCDRRIHDQHPKLACMTHPRMDLPANADEQLSSQSASSVALSHSRPVRSVSPSLLATLLATISYFNASLI